jgi:hypothetical protein
MNHWRARLAVLGVFVAGMLCGAATLSLVRARIDRRVHEHHHDLARVIVSRLDRELHLTPIQRQRVVDVVAASRNDVDRVMQPVLPSIAAILEHAKGQVRDLLDVKQRERFDQLVRDRGGLFPPLGGPHGPATPPGPPGGPR